MLDKVVLPEPLEEAEALVDAPLVDEPPVPVLTPPVPDEPDEVPLVEEPAVPVLAPPFPDAPPTPDELPVELDVPLVEEVEAEELGEEPLDSPELVLPELAPDDAAPESLELLPPHAASAARVAAERSTIGRERGIVEVPSMRASVESPTRQTQPRARLPRIADGRVDSGKATPDTGARCGTPGPLSWKPGPRWRTPGLLSRKPDWRCRPALLANRSAAKQLGPRPGR